MNKNSMVGYHGTTRENAEKIVSEQSFIDSDKENDWLGRGVYFFAYKWHASWWVTHNRYRGKKVEILEAKLQYTDEQMLDLDDPEQLRILDDIVKYAVANANSSNDPIRADLKTKQEHWCFACNLIKKLDLSIGIMVYTFQDSGKRFEYEYSKFSGNQRQICVSDHSIITDVKIV